MLGQISGIRNEAEARIKQALREKHHKDVLPSTPSSSFFLGGLPRSAPQTRILTIYARLGRSSQRFPAGLREPIICPE